MTAVPAVHARGLLGRMLPPVMGSVLEHLVDGQVRRRVYVSGDTLTGDHVDEVRERFPDIDAAVVHLGGTRVLLRTVTMDGGWASTSSSAPARGSWCRCTTTTTPCSGRRWATSSNEPVPPASAARLRCPERGGVVSLVPDPLG